jgi:broad specificity phosphatase PhoE
MTKEIYLIRHAQSDANAALDLDEPNTFYYDARITSLGRKQALNTQKKLKDVNFDLMICSPLTRTMQTFSLIFPNPIANSIILPMVREHLDHSCDVGRQPSVLQKEFPNFNFNEISKYWWNNDVPIDEKAINHETIEDLDKRVAKFMNWIKARPEKKIALVSHGTFISRITHFFLDNCEFEIWHLDNG